MSKLIKTKWKCHCHWENDIKVKKPSLFEPGIGTGKCEECGSKYVVRVKIPKGPRAKNAVMVETKPLFLSPKLIELLKAEQAWQKAQEASEAANAKGTSAVFNEEAPQAEIPPIGAEPKEATI